MSQKVIMDYICKYFLQSSYRQTPQNLDLLENIVQIPAGIAPQNLDPPDDIVQIPPDIAPQNLDPPDDTVQILHGIGEDTYFGDVDFRMLGRDLRDISDTFKSSESRREIMLAAESVDICFLETKVDFWKLSEGYWILRNLRNEEWNKEVRFIVEMINLYFGENEELRRIKVFLGESEEQPLITIAKHLRKCLTSVTFRLALQDLCYSSSSVPEEVAAASDLASVICPRFQDIVRANSIYNELGEFIEKCLIAEHLRKCLTSVTFRMALQHLCYSSSSVSEEVAAACDLASVIYPRFQDIVRANSIYNELGEFIEKCLGENQSLDYRR